MPGSELTFISQGTAVRKSLSDVFEFQVFIAILKFKITYGLIFFFIYFFKILTHQTKNTIKQESAKEIYLFVYPTWQVQTAHLLNPKGGMYGCHLLPSGWNLSFPPRVHPRPEAVAGWEQVAQHSPAGMIGSLHVVTGQIISSHTTRPRWQLE